MRRSISSRCLLLLALMVIFMGVMFAKMMACFQRLPIDAGHVTTRPSSSSSSLRQPPKPPPRGNLTMPHLPTLPRCVNVRIRGHENDTVLSTEQAEDLLRSTSSSSSSDDERELRWGVVSVEHADHFVGLKAGAFHLFHFLEFAVVAFAQLHRFSVVERRGRGRYHHDVQWWYAPLLTRTELCGGDGGMNCHILQYLWPTFWTVHGLEANSDEMRSWHEAYRGILRKRPDATNAMDAHEWNDSNNNNSQRRHENMLDQVDALLLIDRLQCQRKQTVRINKMWTQYMDSFPALAWYDAISRGLRRRQAAVSDPASPDSLNASSSILRHDNDDDELVVCYVDRQNTRRRLPDTFHSWLIRYLRRHHSDNASVRFVHLRMERYTATAQIHVARQCDVLVGVHGNGLSHQLWMKPGSSYVMELYWDFSFQYDYATTAQMMNHTYRGLCNGEIMDARRIQARDRTMMQSCPTVHPWNVTHWNMTASQEAVRSFIEQAVREKGL